MDLVALALGFWLPLLAGNWTCSESLLKFAITALCGAAALASFFARRKTSFLSRRHSVSSGSSSISSINFEHASLVQLCAGGHHSSLPYTLQSKTGWITGSMLKVTLFDLHG